MAPKIPLTAHQKAQIRHLQVLFGRHVSENTLADPSEQQQPATLTLDLSTTPNKTVEIALHVEPKKSIHAAAGDGDGDEVTDPNSSSTRRDDLLYQMDLVISLRKQMETALQKLKGLENKPENARKLMLETELKHTQLRLAALTEAIRGGYVLDNYDYYIDHYERVLQNRTTAQALRSLDRKAGHLASVTRPSFLVPIYDNKKDPIAPTAAAENAGEREPKRKYLRFVHEVSISTDAQKLKNSDIKEKDAPPEQDDDDTKRMKLSETQAL